MDKTLNMSKTASSPCERQHVDTELPKADSAHDAVSHESESLGDLLEGPADDPALHERGSI